MQKKYKKKLAEQKKVFIFVLQNKIKTIMQNFQQRFGEPQVTKLNKPDFPDASKREIPKNTFKRPNIIYDEDNLVRCHNSVWRHYGIDAKGGKRHSVEGSFAIMFLTFIVMCLILYLLTK